MSEGRLKSRITGGAVLALAGAVMFVVPSAVVISRGGPRWPALAIGVVAFPLLPVGWHAFAEWRRKRRTPAAKAPAKSGLTIWDRFVLRMVVVAVVALGGTWAIVRGETWSALRHHALWFTDWTDPDPIVDSEVLARVPAMAEAVLWIRPGHTQDLLPMALSGDAEIAIAFGGDEQLIVARAADEVLDELERLSALGLDGKRLTRVDAPAGMRILATPKWRTPVLAMPAGLRTLLRQAPAAANAIVVARPTTLARYKGVRSVLGWAEVQSTGVMFSADVEVVDAATGDKVIAYAGKARDSEDCGNRAFGDATDTSLVRDGLHVRGSAMLPLEAAREIPRCMTARGF